MLLIDVVDRCIRFQSIAGPSSEANPPRGRARRTTDWRKRKAEAEAAAVGAALAEKSRQFRGISCCFTNNNNLSLLIGKIVQKDYTCRSCGLVMTADTGHSQSRGLRYCPLNNPLSKDEWLEEQRKKRAQLAK